MLSVKEAVKAKIDSGEWEFPIGFFSIPKNFDSFEEVPQGDCIIEGVHYRLSVCSLEVYKISHLFHGQVR